MYPHYHYYHYASLKLFLSVGQIILPLRISFCAIINFSGVLIEFMVCFS